MKKKEISTCKNGRFTAIFATAICLCMLFAACSPDDPGANPTPQTAATPTATPASGEVADNTAITLATATEGAKVYYTQDGTAPDTTSALYSDSNKPVITTGKLTLKAIAVKDGMNNSATLTAVYTITTAQSNGPPTITNAGTDLPANTGALTADGLTVNLTGTAADPDGDTLSYQWQCTGYDHGTYVVTGAGSVAAGINSGIGGASGNGTAAVTLRKAGTYTFKLSVSDSVNSAVESEPVTVTVEGYTATLNGVTVSFPAYTSGKTSINFTPTYAPLNNEWKEFSEADITYTVEDDSVPTKVKDSTTGFTVNAADGLYEAFTTHAFTQIFKQNGVEVGCKVIKVTMNSVPAFTTLSNDDGPLSPQTFPSVTLNLSKTITEVLPPPDAVVSFVSLAASFPAPTIDFSPSAALPVGVTYILTDGTNNWNSASGFNGQVASSGYSVGPVTFTQTFYLNGTEITGAGSQRTVHMTVLPMGFSLNTDSGSVTLWYNP